MEKDQKTSGNKLIRRNEVQNRTGLGASSIYALMEQGKFPKPVKLTERRVAWMESDIDKWISDTIKGAREEYDPVLTAVTKAKNADTGEDQKMDCTNIRDRIAIAAMQAIVIGNHQGFDRKGIAFDAYALADAMLDARGEQ